MKKMLFGLIATFVISFSGNAQKTTKEEARLQFATSMSNLVNQCKPSYKSGMTYTDFTQVILAGNSNSTIPTKEGQNLLNTSYGFLSKGASSTDILKSYNGVEMAAAAKIIKDEKTAFDAGVKLFGSKIINDTPFGQAIVSGKACWICGVFNWIWEHREEIIQIVCMFVSC